MIGAVECASALSASTCVTAAAGLIPIAGDAVKLAMRKGDDIVEVTISRANDGKVLVDAPNATISVDPSRATRGTPEYELLNNPPANTRVELSDVTTFRTGKGGFVDEVTYQPVNSSGVWDGRQTAVGREGIDGDVGEHIQACRHGGTCDRFNLFPKEFRVVQQTEPRLGRIIFALLAVGPCRFGSSD